MDIKQIMKARPSTKWEDVIGLEDVKTALLESVVLPFKFPQLFQGSRRPYHTGILVYGAPGTGKTLLAKALSSLIPDVTYIHVNASDLISKYVGDSEKSIKVLFDKAHEDAPCILVIDDIDILCPEKYERESTTNIITEIVVQMGRPWEKDKGVYVIATSNVPWKINSNIRRVLSKRIHVSLPDSSARSQMFKQVMGETDHSLSDDDFRLLGEQSKGFTGSDIVCTVRDAQMEPVREVSKATHFKKVSGPSVKDPNMTVDDLLTPCAPDDPEAIKMDWTELQEDKLLPKKVGMETLLHALSKSRPTVSNQDLKELKKFTEDFGPL